MTIRFLQTVPSGNPNFPFQAGQIITIDDPAPFMHLLDGVRAEVVSTDTTERAIEPDAEQPEPAKVKGRKRERL
jgi:hypothetical protein